ncbi:MOSC domain-containing protein [Oceanobacillus senegalensis]|uniref:MOSC domain-containing protein n=1 Tax=Oceanobacillus senegalensis TaxID=1936063 RepID=UPI000A312B3E|nr:MOSC domain-containing protein [Oceanobacillus senegalensis]
MDEPYVYKIFFPDGKPSGEKKVWLYEMGISTGEEGDKAIFTYPIKHYTFWQEEKSEMLTYGEMGENFSVLEMDEFTVFIGDTFQMGDAIIQVSRPGVAKTKELRESMRTGWYFRVVQEGYVEEGTDLNLLDRPYPQWSIAACNEIMYLNKHDLRLADELSSCRELATNWRVALRKRARGF